MVFGVWLGDGKAVQQHPDCQAIIVFARHGSNNQTCPNTGTSAGVAPVSGAKPNQEWIFQEQTKLVHLESNRGQTFVAIQLQLQ